MDGEEIVGAGAGGDAGGAVDTSVVDQTQGGGADGGAGAGGGTQDITQPGSEETQLAPNLEDLFKDPEADPNAQVVDPNAAKPEIPAEFQQVLGISSYVKDATQLRGAVHLADEVLKVQNGQAPIAGLLENFRTQNEPAFVKAVQENLIPYLEMLTGKKLMDPKALPADQQKTPEQARIDAIEERFQQEEQTRQQQQIVQQVQRAQGVLIQSADNALKGTWLEGQAKEILPQLAAHMGMDEQQATQALLSGNTAIVDKAVKALIAQKEAEGRKWAQFKIAESKKLKSGLPAGKGNPRVAADGELAEDATRAEKIAFLTQ